MPANVTYQSRNVPEILFINPPFGTVGDPYISIPTLAAYLRQRNIAVSAIDLKQEFYFHLLTPHNILKGLRRAKERFIELNNASQLTFPQAYEYQVLLMILSDLQSFKKITNLLLLPFADFSNAVQDSKALPLFIRAATFPYFPEIIIPDLQFMAFSEYHPCSSADILKACDRTDGYVPLYERILTTTVIPYHRPHIIGFSVAFPSQIIPAFQCAKILKTHLPDIHITMGGPSISVHFRNVHEKRLFGIVDSFVIDEGEIPLETLAQELLHPHPDLRKVPGLIYCAEDRIHCNSPASSFDLTQSPPPDYSIFPLDRYPVSKANVMAAFRLSKGCKWQKCTLCRTEMPFCKNYQSLTVEHAYEQLAHLIKHDGLKYFIFTDDTAAPRNLEYISNRLLQDNLKIRWLAHTRVSKELTKERCILYRESGCVQLSLGVESFSDRILTLMGKGTSVQLIEEVLTEIGGTVPLLAYMIVGFPTETEEEALQGYEALQSFVSRGTLPYYTYTPFLLLRYSTIWNHLDRYQVSDLSIPEGVDLSPDVFRFHHPGMSRERAFQLASDFQRPFRRHLSLQEVVVDDAYVPLNYDCQQVATLIDTHIFTDLPQIRWLRSHENIIMRPSRSKIPADPREQTIGY